MKMVSNMHKLKAKRMALKRIMTGEVPVESEGRHRDVRINDLGQFWIKTGSGIWTFHGTLQDDPNNNKMFFVSAEPCCDHGKKDDVAVSLSGYWWKHKGEDGWEFQGSLVPQQPQDIVVDDLRVDGNFSVPIVDNKIPVYNRDGVLVGHIAFDPV